MKPYGLPRDKDIEDPDVVDIQNYGLNSSTGKFKTKSGEYKSYIRSTKKRHKTRLFFKRKERLLGKKLCVENIEE